MAVNGVPASVLSALRLRTKGSSPMLTRDGLGIAADRTRGPVPWLATAPSHASAALNDKHTPMLVIDVPFGFPRGRGPVSLGYGPSGRDPGNSISSVAAVQLD